MLLTHFLNFVKTHFKVANFFWSIPFRFNKKNRIERIHSPWIIYSFRFQSFISVLYCLIQVYSFTFASLELAQKLQGYVFFLIYLIHTICRWNYGLDNGGIQMINSFFDFEEKFIKEYGPIQMSMEIRGLFLNIGLLESTVVSLPPLTSLLILHSPCQPPSFLLSMTENCKDIQWLTMEHFWKLGVVAIECWMGWHIFASSCCWVFYCFCTGIGSLLSYIDVLLRKIKTNPGFCDTEECIILYRKLQGMENAMNDFLIRKVTPAMLSIVPGIQITSQFVCIQLHEQIPYPAFLAFPLVVADTFLLNLMVITFASGIFKRSTRALNYMHQMSRKKEIRKAVRASAALKLKFGSNFVDEGTPLVIQDFCSNQTISLVLLSAEAGGG